MITVAEIKRKAENIYPEYLRTIISGEIFFPKIIRSDKSVSDDFNEMRKELTEVIEQSKDRKSFGYTITYKQVNTRKHGIQSLPEEISFQSKTDYLKYLRKEAEVETFKKNTENILNRFPALNDWIKKYPTKVIQHSAIWKELLDVCQYFKQNPKPNLYIREMPVQVHTKFIESNKGILLEILNIVLPVTHINEEYLTARDFEKRFGLKYNQSQIRVRILDQVIADKYLSGLNDIEITEEKFNNFNFPCEKVFILENKTNFSNLMNFLTLPQMESAIGIFGSGFKVGNLKNALWLTDKEIFYWGDIDTHGLQILSQIRGYFPDTKSLMMDFDTLNSFKDDWDRGEPTNATHLPHLHSGEHDLFLFVKENNIRLEQEKISQPYVMRQINKI
ncbi:MAG: hypothetical protein HY840_03950 [Bacteroidetes bacterium]|nr:hypothetical protein [Bacteroidota bacterium]